MVAACSGPSDRSGQPLSSRLLLPAWPIAPATVWRMPSPLALVLDVVGALARDSGDRAHAPVEAFFHVERLPRVGLLVLRHAVRDLCRIALRRAVTAAG